MHGGNKNNSSKNLYDSSRFESLIDTHICVGQTINSIVKHSTQTHWARTLTCISIHTLNNMYEWRVQAFEAG